MSMKILVTTAFEPEYRAVVQSLKRLSSGDVSLHSFSEGRGMAEWSNSSRSDSVSVLKTGWGKVNSASMVASHLTARLYDLVVMVGVCGSHVSGSRLSVVVPHKVYQWDADCAHLAPLYTMPPRKESYYPVSPEYGARLVHAVSKAKFPLAGDAGNGLIYMGTGDKFVTGRLPHALQPSAVDMEAAAVAQVCELREKPFIVVKTVSDVIGDDDFIPAMVGKAARRSATVLRLFLKDVLSL